ncbi:MAG: hypothetical protein LC804_26995, partial [Acidobacteria bacterium]|nr:hypothetical protein [Acidobacteriota bacterium]
SDATRPAAAARRSAGFTAGPGCSFHAPGERLRSIAHAMTRAAQRLGKVNDPARVRSRSERPGSGTRSTPEAAAAGEDERQCRHQRWSQHHEKGSVLTVYRH